MMKDIERGEELDAHGNQASAFVNKKPIRLFGMPISEYSPSSQILICSLGTFGFYLLNGYAQERIFHYPGYQFGWFLTGFQFGVYTLLSGLELFFSGKRGPTPAPWREYATVAAIMVSTMGLSNAAFNYLSYPIHLIPVMIGGRFINHRSYSYLEVISALFLTAGLSVLALESFSGDETKSLKIEVLGVIMISCALVADGFLGNMQERLLSTYSVTQNELVFHTHIVGVVLVGVVTVAIGELGPAITYIFSENWSVLIWLAIFTLAGYAGIAFVLTLIELYGSFVAMTVTSCRKVLSISLSFVFFPKPLSSYFVSSAILVFTGIYLHIYSKNSKEMSNYAAKIAHWFGARKSESSSAVTRSE